MFNIGLRTFLPMIGERISAGYPSPAEDWVEGSIDLNLELITHPSSTFLFRVMGQSMIGVGIGEGDLLIVDRALEARHNTIVVAIVDGELTVKRLYQKGGLVRLEPENQRFKPIEFNGKEELSIWGVVKHSIKSF
ncbi:MAG: LexA family protein [Sphingomonadales bacterium]